MKQPFSFLIFPASGSRFNLWFNFTPYALRVYALVVINLRVAARGANFLRIFKRSLWVELHSNRLKFGHKFSCSERAARGFSLNKENFFVVAPAK